VALGIKSVSIRITIFSALLGTILFTTIMNAGISSLHVRNLVSETIKEDLRIAVGIGARRISGSAHSRIALPHDINSENFATIFGQLEDMRAIDADIKNAYTIRQNVDGKVVFVVDADPVIAERAEVGRQLHTVTRAISTAFEKKIITVEDDYYTDEWGTFISGYAPFYRESGELEGLLCMDVEATTIKAHQYNNILVILITSLLVTGIAFFISLKLSQQISRPVKEVTADMGEIQKLNLASRPATESVILEIREMTDALNGMKKGLRSFRKYVPCELVSDLIKLKKEAALEVENRQISVLFTDIQNFTRISEQIAPAELAQAISVYFGEMSQAIMATGGIVDKFIGDAIMALWGAPHDLPDQALAACKAALACRQKEIELNRQLADKGLPPFFTRMGINTGEALVGNIGFDQRMSYTAIGDSVNLASRLEGVNKYYQTGIIISETTYEMAKEAILARFLDVVAVKGKSQRVKIYELLALSADADENLRNQVARYNEAMELYLSRNWHSALKIFNALKTEVPDFPLQMIIGRCENFLANPPECDCFCIVNLRDK